MALDKLSHRTLAILADIKASTNPWQDRAVLSPKRHVIMRAARRTGKSYCAAKRAFTKKIIYNNTRTWIVGPSYDLAEKEFRYILDFTRTFCRVNELPPPEPVRHNPGAGDLYIRTPWGAEVIGKSAQKPETLVGEELDCLLMSEAALHHKSTWERYLRPTLTTRNGISIWPFTPDAGGLWLYELELAAADNPQWDVFTLPAWECPHYAQDEIEQARRELSEDAFYEQYGGEWRFYTGRVYKVFKADTHLVEPFPIPKSWKLYTATDFGYRDPTCTLWMAVSPTGEAYFVDEYYKTGEATQDHVATMLDQEQKRDLPPYTCRIADHHGLGNQLITDASRLGWHTVACRSNDRRARRDRSVTAFTPKARPAPYHVREHGAPPSPTGLYPDAYIFKGRCPNLVREIQFCRFKETSRKEGSVADTEGDDHAIDAMEYDIEYANLGQSSRRERNKRGMQQSTYRPACQLTGY